MNKLVVNCATGSARPVPLTEAEQAIAADQISAGEVDRQDELVAVTNADQLRDRARAALASNREFLAKANPSTADVVAQVRLLTRECSALIRLVINELGATD